MAEASDTPSSVPPEMLEHYSTGYEAQRLQQGASHIELVRSQEIIMRYIPKPPAMVLDIGGGPGVYAFWLAKQGYEVHLIDVNPLHIEQARQTSLLQPDAPLAEMTVSDARSVKRADASVDVVLLMGPLYHLTAREDRLTALRAAYRILKPGGILFAAAISRFASLLDGLRLGLFDDPAFADIVERDLTGGQHRNPTNHPEYFTTAFFHHPHELEAEIKESGFLYEKTLPVEGPLWLSPYVIDNFADRERRERFLGLMRRIENEPMLLGATAHLLAIGRKQPSMLG